MKYMIAEEIWEVINKYQALNSVYREEYGNEYSLEEELSGILENEHIQGGVDVYCVFDSPGTSIYAVAVAYMTPEGRFEIITDSIESY